MSNFGLTPYRRANRHIRPYTSLTNTFFNDDFFRNFFSSAVTAPQMNIDVKDEKDKYVIEAELPGVKKEDINIDIDNGVLTLSTKVQNEKNEDNDNYVYRERRYGSLSRSFSLDNIDDENIKAKYEDGILVVELPKKEPEVKQNRAIEIK
jgi:HSP20 family protein